ncbi:hypothetical protein CONCODRAFT_12713 [Conidiobolus coronatus NRRL 28638]|uniref:Uncharacterized protein n=1 Tax=Conidiobolus coronatus (strain ATCC 28846 / CBS 209.66 / NRRL 28638) TaxID=796925 RepID=A0A137NSA3_CONC2|nr:hypothetical protein CONCODRAFT_12713 [Conidiobolus coronatus NRRL 28638]|eukprot:KXN65635.1 hypothetical protein CONCODRAFT_12713 [Conidiobolus coronatus NRRL 28638]
MLWSFYDLQVQMNVNKFSNYALIPRFSFANSLYKITSLVLLPLPSRNSTSIEILLNSYEESLDNESLDNES